MMKGNDLWRGHHFTIQADIDGSVAVDNIKSSGLFFNGREVFSEGKPEGRRRQERFVQETDSVNNNSPIG